jgi:hypothetical protein
MKRRKKFQTLGTLEKKHFRSDQGKITGPPLQIPPCIQRKRAFGVKIETCSSGFTNKKGLHSSEMSLRKGHSWDRPCEIPHYRSYFS